MSNTYSIEITHRCLIGGIPRQPGERVEVRRDDALALVNGNRGRYVDAADADRMHRQTHAVDVAMVQRFRSHL